MKKIIITGNVSKGPDLRADQNGNHFAIFSVAVPVGTKANPRTDWVDVICNEKLADVARNYIKKGTKILVEGFPNAHAYINRENQPIAILRIYANIIELLSSRENDNDTDIADQNEPTCISEPELSTVVDSDEPGSLS